MPKKKPRRAPYCGAPTPIPVPSRIWYFAEGSTAETFKTYLVLYNPQTVAADATITYMKGASVLGMRFELDLYINQRPFAGTAPGGSTPHEFIVIRENTEGPYVDEGGVLRRGTPNSRRHTVSEV